MTHIPEPEAEAIRARLRIGEKPETIARDLRRDVRTVRRVGRADYDTWTAYQLARVREMGPVVV